MNTINRASRYAAFLLLIIIMVLYVSTSGVPVLALEGIREDDFLKADGKVIRNRRGEVVVLRGTNIGGWLIQESWMTPTNSPYQKETIKVLTERFGEEVKDQLIAVYEDHYFTEEDLDFIKEFGMNVIRLPFFYLNIQDESGNLKENAWQRLDWLIENCAARGIYVILDLHGAQGSQNGKDHSGDASSGSQFFKNEAYIINTIKLWEEIAKRYKDSPAVAAYDILNEPGGDANKTTSMQWDVFDRIYDAIRAVDTEHIIMMESCWEPNNLPDPSKYGWENVVYQYHNYCWNADNNFSKQKEFVDRKVSSISKADYNVPTFIGEFTAFVNLASWQYTLAKYNEAGYSWTTWTYKVTGNSSWGIKNQNVPKVDIYNDTKEEIIAKWKRAGESIVNKKYHQVIKDYINGNTTLPKQAVPVKASQTAPTVLQAAPVKTGLKTNLLIVIGVVFGMTILVIAGFILRKKKKKY